MKLIFLIGWICMCVYFCFFQPSFQEEHILTKIFVFVLMAGWPIHSLITQAQTGGFYDADDIGDDGDF